MRNMPACAIVAAIWVITACTKHQVQPPLPGKSFIGQWQLLRSTGGLSGNDTVLPPAGTKQVLTLNADSSFQLFVTGHENISGIYSISLVKRNVTLVDTIIHFNQPSMSRVQIINVQEPYLTLEDDHYEPYRDLYKRVQ